MFSRLILGAVVAAALFLGGYWLGVGGLPLVSPSKPTIARTAAAQGTAGRKVLYWKDPDGKADFSAAPKKTADGRDYIPVYDEEEPALALSPSAKPSGKRKILYYRNPMGLPDTSPAPKKDWMGMDYIPVYEGEELDAGTVRVSLDRVQRTGVRTEVASLRTLSRPVRAPGIAKPDERTLRSVVLRADGFIEKLYANETGMHVRAGEPMFVVYSRRSSPYRSIIEAPEEQAMRAKGRLGRCNASGISDCPKVPSSRSDPVSTH
jgi:Cu(I)/Ag(I) efflux system membrane fusion protein